MSDEFFDYEQQEPRNNLIAFLLITSCLFVVGACALMAWMFSVVRDNEHNRKLNQANYVELQELREKEEMRLNGYQYVDKESGIVRIPVERAMQLMAEEARSAQPKADAMAPAASATPAAAATATKPEAKPAETKSAAPAPAKAAAPGH